MGYFQNVSGSFYTRDIRIFNLTSPASGVSWFTIAEEYMKDVNNTEVMDRVNTWNWAASARAILGVFDFVPESVSDGKGGYVNRFRARSFSHKSTKSVLIRRTGIDRPGTRKPRWITCSLSNRQPPDRRDPLPKKRYSLWAGGTKGVCLALSLVIIRV